MNDNLSHFNNGQPNSNQNMQNFYQNGPSQPQPNFNQNFGGQMGGNMGGNMAGAMPQNNGNPYMSGAMPQNNGNPYMRGPMPQSNQNPYLSRPIQSQNDYIPYSNDKNTSDKPASKRFNIFGFIGFIGNIVSIEILLFLFDRLSHHDRELFSIIFSTIPLVISTIGFIIDLKTKNKYKEHGLTIAGFIINISFFIISLIQLMD